MNLHDEMEAYSRQATGSRLRSSEVRGELGARVRRGRAVRSGTLAGGGLALGLAVAWGALQVTQFGPEEVSPLAPGTPAPTPSPSAFQEPSVSPEAAEASPSPSPWVAADGSSVGPGDPGYLARAQGSRLSESLPGCAAEGLIGSHVEFDDGADQELPVPTWLETGRLYGYGDDALIGGYPTPLGTDLNADPGGMEAWVSAVDGEPARLVLVGPWLVADPITYEFTAEWSYRDDLPHDAPGWFVSLSQAWDCGSGAIVPPGSYSALLAVTTDDGTTRIYDLAQIVVRPGVPSIPSLDPGE